MENSKRKTLTSPKVVITGGEGCIGSILRGDFSDYDVYSIDIREGEGQKCFEMDIASEYNKLKEIFKGKDVVIHLAWDFSEDFPGETIKSKNKLMAENVYRAAVEAGVKRVIVASSVHANNYSQAEKQKNFDIEFPSPDSLYGASKVYIEALGKYYANRYGLEIICIRFGGVNIKDEVIFEEDHNYDKVLLYKEDAIEAVRRCIKIESTPSNFQVFTVVSNNKNRIHLIDNFLGWQPRLP